MEGRLRYPRRYLDPSLSDTWDSLKRQGRLLQVSVRADRVVVIGREEGWLWRLGRGLDGLRDAARGWLAKNCGDPDALALLYALLLGDRSLLRPAIVEAFGRLGLSHLLAISGLHLALLASLGFWLFLRLFSLSLRLLLAGWAEKAAALATFPLVLGYTLLSGAAISTLRALAMISVFFASLLWARKPSIGTSLSLAAFLLLLYDPTSLFSASFQLSFAAVWILAFLLPSYLPPRPTTLDDLPPPHGRANPWKPRLWAFGMKLALAPALSSLIVVLGTLPLTASWAPWFPWFGIFVNPVAIPLCGFGCVAPGLASLLLAPVCPLLASWSLQIATFASRQLLESGLLLASWPSVAVTLPPFRWYEVAALLLALAIVPCLRSPRFRPFGRLCGGLSLLLAFGGSAASHLLASRSSELQIDLLDVGQGDAISIRFPNGQRMLVDAGGEPFAPVDVAQRLLLPYFRHERVHSLDVAVLSHPHPDHFGGFTTLLGRLPIREFWATPMKGDHPGYKAFSQAIKHSPAAKASLPSPPTRWFGEVRVDILHPFPPSGEGDGYYWGLHANDNSLVLLLTYRKIRILLSGDLEAGGERILLQRYPKLQVDLLKIGHHGSRTSSTDAFLDALRPKAAVVSLGRHNLFGFPHPAIRQRFAQRSIPVWRTDQCGRLRVTTEGSRLSILPHLQPCQVKTFP